MNFVERPVWKPKQKTTAVKEALLATAENKKAVQLTDVYRSSYSQYGWFKERGFKLITKTVEQVDGSKVLVGWCEKLPETGKDN